MLAFNWEYIGGANSFTGIGLKTSVWTARSAALIALYVAWRFDGSRLGFACRAVRDDPLAASAMGVSIALTRIVTFALGGALVGMAGAIQAHYVLVISPHDLGFFVSLNFIIFLLFGGLQTLWGPMLGAVLLTVAAGDAPLHQRVPADPLRPHHRGGGAAAAGGPLDAPADRHRARLLRFHAGRARPRGAAA